MSYSRQRLCLQVYHPCLSCHLSTCRIIDCQGKATFCCLDFDFQNSSSRETLFYLITYPSLDDIFLHIGNVTELILTGNEITSTRGLDRLFSLERLSLDENKIHHLAHIAGIAKIPFLMNFDLKGNPIEADGKVVSSFCHLSLVRLTLVFVLTFP